MLSPRSHRSQRTHRTRRSGSGSGSGSRQRQEQYTGTTRYASQSAPPFPQPEFQSEPQYPPDPDPNYTDNNARTGEDEVPENLHQDYASFNLDPAGPILGGVGEESIRQAMEDEQHRGGVTSSNFVGGFVGTLKHALSHGRSRGRRRGEDVEAAYADGYGYRDGGDNYDIGNGHDTSRDHNSDPEPSPSSETMHGGTVEYADDGTTAVDHQIPILNPGHYVTPVIAVPQLAPDYAKMGSGSPSDSDAYTDAYADAYANGHTSSNQYPNTYMSRFARFLRHLNDLPWVAESRVTVDYYPGQQSKRRGARSRSRTAGGRPILSWYNRHTFLGKRNTTIGSLVDLDLNASPVPTQKPEPTPLMVQMNHYPYPQTQDDNNNLDQPIYLPTVPISPSEIDPAHAYYAEPINLPHPIHLSTPIPTNLEPAIISTNPNPTVPQATTPADPTIPLTHPNPTLPPSSFPLPPPPPRSEAGHSARTSRTARTTGGRSIVYSVVNPSAPSGSSTTSSSAGVTSPLVSRPPPSWVNQRVGMGGTRTDEMTAIAQNSTGYTPSQPQASRYGRGIHEAVAGTTMNGNGVSYQV